MLSPSWTQDELDSLVQLAGAGFDATALTRLDATSPATRELYAALGNGLQTAFSMFAFIEPSRLATQTRLHAELLHAALGRIRTLEMSQAAPANSAALAAEVEDLKAKLLDMESERDKAVGQLRKQATDATAYNAATIKALEERAKLAERSTESAKRAAAEERRRFVAEKELLHQLVKTGEKQVLNLKQHVAALEAAPKPVEPKELVERLGHLAHLGGTTDDWAELLGLALTQRRYADPNQRGYFVALTRTPNAGMLKILVNGSNEVAEAEVRSEGNVGGEHDLSYGEDGDMNDDASAGEAIPRSTEELLPDFKMIDEDDVVYVPGEPRLSFVAVALARRGLSPDSARKLADGLVDLSPYFSRAQLVELIAEFVDVEGESGLDADWIKATPADVVSDAQRLAEERGSGSDESQSMDTGDNGNLVRPAAARLVDVPAGPPSKRARRESDVSDMTTGVAEHGSADAGVAEGADSIRLTAAQYNTILVTKPWDAMYDNRVRHLRCHRLESLPLSVRSFLSEIVGFMSTYRQNFWERQHRVLLEPDAHAGREKRDDRFSARWRKLIKRAKTAGFDVALWYEPALWFRDAQTWPLALKDPVRVSLTDQIKSVDEREPIRIGWATDLRGYREFLPEQFVLGGNWDELPADEIAAQEVLEPSVRIF